MRSGGGEGRKSQTAEPRSTPRIAAAFAHNFCTKNTVENQRLSDRPFILIFAKRHYLCPTTVLGNLTISRNDFCYTDTTVSCSPKIAICLSPMNSIAKTLRIVIYFGMLKYIRNYITSHWRGQQPLMRSLIFNLIIINFIFAGCIPFIILRLSSHFAQPHIYYIIISWVISDITALWVCVGVFRSAIRTYKTRNSKAYLIPLILIIFYFFIQLADTVRVVYSHCH